MFPSIAENRRRRKNALPIASSVTLLLCLSLIALADPPRGYYGLVEAADSTTLRTALHAVIDNQTRFP